MVVIRVKAIIPKNTLDATVLDSLLRQEVRKEARAVERELGSPTRKWKHKAEFRIQETPEGATIGTADKVYSYVDQGTKAHTIRPRKAKVLAFNSQFKAKTKPDSLNSSAGRNAPPKVFAMAVRHPGTKARGFVKLVAKRSKVRFPANVDKAVRLAVARANKG